MVFLNHLISWRIPNLVLRLDTTLNTLSCSRPIYSWMLKQRWNSSNNIFQILKKHSIQYPILFFFVNWIIVHEPALDLVESWSEATKRWRQFPFSTCSSVLEGLGTSGLCPRSSAFSDFYKWSSSRIDNPISQHTFCFLRGMTRSWEAKLDIASSDVLDWCSLHFIALNLSKTNFIIYGRKSNICHRITRVSSSKYILSVYPVKTMKYLGLFDFDWRKLIF